MSTRQKILGYLVVLGMVLGARAKARNLYVPGSYTTIQVAVNPEFSKILILS